MKREILFRGKRQDNNEWVYGYFYKIGDKTYILKSSLESEGFTMLNVIIEVIPESVGQFTGLLDCKGNRIFEGDVCQIMRMRKYGYDKDNDPLIVGHVKFGRISVNGNDLSVYNAFHVNGRSIEYLIGQELEVIGNIHESLTPNK